MIELQNCYELERSIDVMYREPEKHVKNYHKTLKGIFKFLGSEAEDQNEYSAKTTITRDLRLAGKIFSKKNPKRLVFASHGAGEDHDVFRNDHPDYFNRMVKDSMILSPTMRSHSYSEGVGFDINKIIDDTYDIILRTDSQLKKSTDVKDIVLVGYSLGGYVFVKAAERGLPDSVKSIITISTPVDLYKGLKYRNKTFEYSLSLFDNIENTDNSFRRKIAEKMWNLLRSQVLMDKYGDIYYYKKLRLNDPDEVLRQLKMCKIDGDFPVPTIFINSNSDKRVSGGETLLDKENFQLHVLHKDGRPENEKIIYHKIPGTGKIDHDLLGLDNEVMDIIEKSVLY